MPWRWFVPGGLAVSLVVVYAAAPIGGFGALAVQVGAAVAVVWGIRLHRPAYAAGWWLLAVGLVGYAAAQAYWRIGFAGVKPDIPFGSLNDVLYLVCFGLLVASVGVMLHRATRRREGPQWTGAIDIAIVILGMSSGTWHVLAQPYLPVAGLAPAGLAMFLGYEAIELIRYGLLAQLVLVDGARTGSRRLLIAGYGAVLLGDLIYGVALPAPVTVAPRLQDLFWLCGAVLLGGSALHPTMATERVPERGESTISRARLSLFILLTAISPMMTGIDALFGAEGSVVRRGSLDAIVPMVLGVSVAVLLVIRLGTLAGVAHRRAAQLQVALREQATLRAELAHRVQHDGLTGLGNRGRLTEAIEALEAGPPHALLLIDLDGFKEVNDRYGHPAGDVLLVEVAKRLRAAAGDGSVVARLGGDEFAIVAAACPVDRAEALAEAILRALVEPCSVPGGSAQVTSSIGLLVCHAPISASDALSDADLALYSAKSAGKNRLVRYQPQLRAARSAQQRLNSGLHRALVRDELTLQYQPIVALAGGAVTAVEALLRWRPDGAGPVPPERFIPIAEENATIVPIGTWVLRQACAEAAAWYRQYGISLSINVAARQLREPAFADEVLGVLGAAGLPGSALILEITEGAALDTPGMVLERLRRHGVRIALDDFGTGYSSISYLRRLPVDILKLDSGFALGSSRTTSELAITRAVVDLGSGLGLRTVAEGVETEAQAIALREVGCALGQGFHLGTPADPAATAALLSARVSSPARVTVPR